MARPRIFISSTYFDLKSVREDLDRFVTSLGYEPVRHELGHIAYGQSERPESYALREAEFSDILVSIIGSKFGSTAEGSDYSISQQELRRAYANGKQVYIFIDDAVLSEFKFYQANKGVPDVTYTAVTDTKIYDFIEEIYGLPNGNPIFSFKTAGEIISLLKDQWAGLFQRLLTQDSQRSQALLIEQLQLGLQTVDQMVKFLQQDRENDKESFQAIIINHHPIFSKIRELLNNKYRIFFENLRELSEWFEGARSYVRAQDSDEYYIWIKELISTGRAKGVSYTSIFVAVSLFDADQRLKPIAQSDWDDKWLRIERSHDRPANYPSDIDDIPF